MENRETIDVKDFLEIDRDVEELAEELASVDQEIDQEDLEKEFKQAFEDIPKPRYKARYKEIPKEPIENFDTHRIMAQQRAFFLEETRSDVYKMLSMKSTTTMPKQLNEDYTDLLNKIQELIKFEKQESIR